MLKRVEHGMTTSLVDDKTGRTVQLHLNRGLFGEVFRNFLYSPQAYSLVPHIVHDAARGDFTDFAPAALKYGRAVRTLDFGLLLSVSCGDDIARLDVDAARKAASGTLLGAYRIEQQVAACRIWPHGAADPARVKPLQSSIPTLMISGELDPVTPPKYANEVAKTLTHVTNVMVPKGSHAGDTGGCLEKIAAEAVVSGQVRKLDLSCVADIAGPKFALPKTSSPLP